MNHLEYMRKIGRKGGAKRKTHPLRIEMARKAAITRWTNAKRLSNNDATTLPSYPNNSPSEKDPK